MVADPFLSPEIALVIESLHRSPARGSVAVTGGGSSAIAWLLAVPGASATVVEARVPYAEAALVDLLGLPPEQACSSETARQMAYRMLQRAHRLLEEDGGTSHHPDTLWGVGCTAALASNRPKRGAHRAHVTVCSSTRCFTAHLQLEKGIRTREEEELLCGRLIISTWAQALGIEPVDIGPSGSGCQVVREAFPAATPIQRLLAGMVPFVLVDPQGRCQETSQDFAGLLPGSFNPLHRGHRRLREVAERRLRGPVGYELSVRNVDKPPLTETEVKRRLRQFRGHAWCLLTSAPRFDRKALCCPGTTFLVGCDTALRVVDPRYYGDDPDEMLAALRTIREQGNRFLVAGRCFEGRFQTVEDLPIPAPFRDLFSAVPETEFREDISSTQIRERGASSR